MTTTMINFLTNEPVPFRLQTAIDKMKQEPQYHSFHTGRREWNRPASPGTRLHSGERTAMECLPMEFQQPIHR
ncbi:hypothetical protein [Niabella terrae]